MTVFVNKTNAIKTKYNILIKYTQNIIYLILNILI